MGKIRKALITDCKEILKIYAPYIENTEISFEYEVPSEEEFCCRMKEIMSLYPWIVYEEEGKILGYAYGGPDHTRSAYQWTVESSIYVREDARKKGIGEKLYTALLNILEKQNFCVCYAIITQGNEASIKFHEKMGFYKICDFEGAGYKHGKWLGITYMEKKLHERKNPPDEIIPMPVLGYDTLEE